MVHAPTNHWLTVLITSCIYTLWFTQLYTSILSSVSSLTRQRRPENLTQHRRGVLSGLLVSYRRLITALFNASFRDGVFPSTQKCAAVTPVLKKSLDLSDTTNYRPISNLTFISKMLERCA